MMTDVNLADMSNMGYALLEKIGDIRNKQLVIKLTDGSEVNVVGLGCIVYDIAKEYSK